MGTLHSIIETVSNLDIFNSAPVHLLTNIFYTITDALSNWGGFHIEPARPGTSSIFGLAQFLSTLALLVVVFNVSDFRFRYRLSVTRYDVRRAAIITASIIAAALLFSEVWFQNALPIPHFINHDGNIKILLASVFIVFVLSVVWVCFLQPARLGRSNAVKFLKETTRYIHQGNKDRLQAIAEDLGGGMEDIFRLFTVSIISQESLEIEGKTRARSAAAMRSLINWGASSADGGRRRPRTIDHRFSLPQTA